MTCPHCEYHKNRAARWRAEAYKLVGHEIELPWVGLTDEEIQMCWDGVMDGAVFRRRDVYNAIEAKLKEKNT